jgi:hypothetical protein
LLKGPTSDAVQHDLSPYLRYCFSEYDATGVISLDLITDHFCKVAEGKDGDPLTALTLVGIFISNVGTQLEEENQDNDQIDMYRDQPHAPELVVLSTGTQATSSEQEVDLEFQLYKLATMLNQVQLPHSSQVSSSSFFLSLHFLVTRLSLLTSTSRSSGVLTQPVIETSLTSWIVVKRSTIDTISFWVSTF